MVNVGSIVDVTGREIGKNIGSIGGSIGSAIAGKLEGQSASNEPPPTLERVLSSTAQGASHSSMKPLPR